MFDTSLSEQVTRVGGLLGDASVSTFARFEAIIQAKQLLEAAEAATVAQLAREHAWDESDEYEMDGLRPIRFGADGTQLVDETLPLEIAAAKGITVTTAIWFLRDTINLEARHPNTWTAVQDGRIPLWRGNEVASVCAWLSKDQALQVDTRLRHVLGQVSWRRVRQMLRAAIKVVDPDGQGRETQLTARFCDVRETGEPTSREITAMVDAADATFFDTTIRQIADALQTQGDTGNLDQRRGKAVGVIANPAAALQLINQTGGNVALPKTQVYVHMFDETPTAGEGLARVEGQGPVMVAHLKHVLGHSNVRLTQVVHTSNDFMVDQYEIPDRIRETVVLRDNYEPFPWSATPARHLDLDHTVAYLPGRSGQTRPSNLGPLSRRVHRAKTHGGFQVKQLEPGVFAWITPHGQQFLIGPNGTTTKITPPKPPPNPADNICPF